ncbi:MAG: glycosyltransferase family 4 protein, partial [Deltaproteobacteria bacterium]|nr:glycosyltransferase family 4 protein [Deltaproteobacteria bacterium]
MIPKSSRETEWNGAVRIVFLTDDLGGGTGNHLLSMMKYWDKNRWQTEILSRVPITSRITPDVPVRYVPSDGRINTYPISQIRSLGRIRKKVSERSPDILHTYFFWPILFGRLLKLGGVIRTLIENREDQGFNWGVHEYAWLRLTRGLPDRIICVSDAVKRVVMERERIDGDRIVVIRNGVEPFPDFGKETAETREELGLERRHLVVGMVANFNRSVKGVSLFLDAVPQIVRAVPDARFLLLGRGKEEKELRDKARSMGIEPYVLFAGFRRDIHRYYAIMDVSALTSFSEGLSITLLESMRCGIPVVATRVGGNPEVVVDGETGYLVKPGDATDFASHVIRLLQNRDL